MNRLQKLIHSVKSAIDLEGMKWKYIWGGPPADSEGALNDIYNKIDLAYTCISYTANAISQVPLHLVKISRTGMDRVDENHPLQRIIYRPNYMTSGILFLTGIIINWLIDGSVCIIPFPSPKVVDSLWVVRWKNMKYKIDEKTGHLTEWNYIPNENQKGIRLGPEDIVHLKFWNPNHMIEGFAPSSAGRLPILEYYKSSRYNQAFFDHGAMPGGVLSAPGRIHKDVVEETRVQWRQKHQGFDKAHEVAILQQGLKYEAIAPSHKDMDFANLKKMDREAIMQLYGMKKVILGEAEALNYATSREQRKEWWMGTCLPLMRMIADTLTFGLLGNQPNLKYIFDTTVIEALHDDTDTAVKTMERLFRMGFTRNELNRRFHMGFDEKDWGDVAYVPINMMPVNQGDITPDPNVAPPPTVDAPVNNSYIETVKKALDSGLPGFLKFCSPDGNRFHDRLRSFFFGLRSKCLKMLRQEGISSLIVSSWEKEINEFEQKLGFEIQSLIENGKKFFSDIIDFELDIEESFILSEEIASRYIKERCSHFIAFISQVHGEILKLAQEGISIEEIDQRLRKIFNMVDKNLKGLVKNEIKLTLDFASANCLREVQEEENGLFDKG